MKPKKLRKLLEFKDREQVKSLLALSAGVGEAESKEALLGYITNAKCLLLGFTDGSKLIGLIGIQLLEKKEAKILHLAVRPDEQKSGIGKELIQMAREKQKLKKISVEANSDLHSFFEKCEVEVLN